jgi:hypothetical protein
MTHITEARVIGNHAEMGGSARAVSRMPLTVRDILSAGVRRRLGRREMVAAQGAWVSEGGAIGEGESWPSGREGRAPRGLGR